MAKKTTSTDTSQQYRPPIVAVLGHVDHGKTSLLDFIRKTSVAAREHGGITQHIGAYQIILTDSKSKTSRAITFIDTPGHEAFAKMRSRGATVADIAILVVAADDSVKPQTVESIRMIKEAGSSMLVAINKSDLPTANIDKVKSDLAKAGVQLEGFGGDVPWVKVSAKTGAGVGELLDMISLIAEMKELKNEPEASVKASVIETRVDKGKGMVATLIVLSGTLKSGASLYDNAKMFGKVRAMFDENGAGVTAAAPSRPVEVLGFTQLPTIGSVLTDKAIESEKKVSAEGAKPMGVAEFLKAMEQQRKLKIVLKADTAGSLEAITEALPAEIDIVTQAVGDISEADVLMAKSTGSFVIGFNVRAKPDIEKLASTERVVLRTYAIIYELIDELADVVTGMAEVLTKERELGKGTVIAEFPFNGMRIAGIKVLSGRIARGDQVRVERKEKEIGRAKIKSVRHGKTDVTKIEVGGECGILFDRSIDFTLGDDIIAFTNA